MYCSQIFSSVGLCSIKIKH